MKKLLYSFLIIFAMLSSIKVSGVLPPKYLSDPKFKELKQKTYDLQKQEYDLFNELKTKLDEPGYSYVDAKIYLLKQINTKIEALEQQINQIKPQLDTIMKLYFQKESLEKQRPKKSK
jgi:hypothetical protein